jgi:hypothetical protein
MKIPTKRQVAAACVAAFVLPSLFFVFVYLTAAASEPYRAAEQFVTTNPVIGERVGQIASVRLAFGRIRASYSATSGSARMPLLVKGTSTEGTVEVTLEKNSGTWRWSAPVSDRRMARSRSCASSANL